MAELAPAVRVEQLVIDPRFVSISFMESRKNETAGISEVTTINVATEYVQAELEDAHESLLALLEAAQIAQRHHPRSIPQ